MKRLLVYIICLQGFFATASTQPLTLDDCRRMALEQNRNLRNAALQYGVAPVSYTHPTLPTIA